MSPRNSWLLALFVLPALAQGPALPLDPRAAFKVSLPAQAPVELVNSDWGSSRATARGGALQVDVRSTLLFRNTSGRRIRGVSLEVLAQKVTPGGRASVTVPSLDAQPGESFPLRVELRLMRPLVAGGGPLVEVALDGVLFDDLTFYGPDRLNAHRMLLAWELEARRDRKALLATLDAGGAEALRRRMLQSLARQAEQPGIEMQVSRSLPATNVDAERPVEVAFLHLNESPVEVISASAILSSGEARQPRLDIQNKSKRPIRYLELGWLVRDEQGREFQAGTLPAEVSLQPGQRATVHKENSLRFSRPVSGLTAYPAAVEFADGELWIPSSADLKDPRLARALPVSGEEQRLADLYRRKGLEAVIAQLRNLR